MIPRVSIRCYDCCWRKRRWQIRLPAGPLGKPGGMSERGRAQSHIVVLKLCGHVVDERPLDTRAQRPARICLIVAEGNRLARIYIEQRQIIATNPGGAALCIKEQAVGGHAEPTGQRRKPPAVAAPLEGCAVKSYAITRIIVIGEPVEIALNADDQRVELIVGADLAAADERATIIGPQLKLLMLSLMLPWFQPGAEIAADIEGGPTEWGRRGRHVNRRCARRRSRRKVGSKGLSSRECANTSNKDSTHFHSPRWPSVAGFRATLASPSSLKIAAICCRIHHKNRHGDAKLPPVQEFHFMFMVNIPARGKY